MIDPTCQWVHLFISHNLHSLPNLNPCFGQKLVAGDRKVFWSGTLPNPSRSVVVRSVTGAKPTTKLSLRFPGLVSKRYAAKVSTNTHHNQPFLFLYTIGIRFRIRQFCAIILLCGGYFLLCTVSNENWFAAPDDSNALAFNYGVEVYFCGR